MPKQNVALNKFNRGLVSPLALSRVDLENIPFFAEEQTNWMPRILGSMMLRPGTNYRGDMGDIASNYIKVIPFIFSRNDTAIIELGNSLMRVVIPGASSDEVITRNSVSTAVTNGTFGSDVASWTDNDESGATSAWVTGGYMGLTGTGYASARRTQLVTVAVGDQNVEHGLRVVIARGHVTLKLGSTSGGTEYMAATTLGEGTHSLAFTPTGANLYIDLSASTKYASLVDSVDIEADGEMTFTTVWDSDDIELITYDQSGDIIYVACENPNPILYPAHQQYKIERRATRSWSLVKYIPENGPYRTINTGRTTITPSAIYGDITLTASKALFDSDHVGALFKFESIGQLVQFDATGADQWSSTIKVTGTGTARAVSYIRSGTWTATVTIQKSTDETSWTDHITSITTNGTTSFNDGLDNQIIYYRIGIKAGGYTSGTATLSLDYSGGFIIGHARISAVSSSTSATAHVLSDLGGTAAVTSWYEGQWSNYRDFPTSVALHGGRLFWSGQDKVNGSVSDNYENFDDETEGDSGPINRSIGRGPVDSIAWMLSLRRLILGGEMAEWTVKSNSLDEPLTPTNFSLDSPTTQGSAQVQAKKVDNAVYFVQANGTKVMKMIYDASIEDYVLDDITKLIPEIGATGIKRIAVQRQPDTRIHCVLNDGTVAILIADPAEDVKCWVKYETDGEVKDVVIFPDDTSLANGGEDKVYYYVKRTGIYNTYYHGWTSSIYREFWATEDTCSGLTFNNQLDSYIHYTGVSTTTITGLDHLNGKTVAVWGGTTTPQYLGTYTVASNQITGLSSSATTAVIGLPYTARFKSSKLSYGASGGTPLSQRKRVNALSLIMRNVYQSGIQYGADFDNLDDLPDEYKGEMVASTTVHEDYDIDLMELNGAWDVDARLCLQATGPKPCTVTAAIIQIETHDKG